MTRRSRDRTRATRRAVAAVVVGLVLAGCVPSGGDEPRSQAETDAPDAPAPDVPDDTDADADADAAASGGRYTMPDLGCADLYLLLPEYLRLPELDDRSVEAEDFVRCEWTAPVFDGTAVVKVQVETNDYDASKIDSILGSGYEGFTQPPSLVPHGAMFQWQDDRTEAFSGHHGVVIFPGLTVGLGGIGWQEGSGLKNPEDALGLALAVVGKGA